MTFQVSVVVPVHNGAPFAAQCVAFLKAQTLRDVEFLIVDDASTDGTLEELRREIAGDGRFQILSQEKKAGPLSARMRGVYKASAPVVMFMDFDDEIVPDACRIVANTMSRGGIDVFCYAMDAVGSNGCDERALGKCRSYLARRSPRQGSVRSAKDCFDLFFSNSGITASACDKAVKTEVLRRVYDMIGDGTGLLCAQDFLQTTLLFLNVESIFVDQSQVLYRYHLGSGMSGHAAGNVTWGQFTRRTTAIDSYMRLCRVLSAREDMDSALRERIEGRFLRSIRGTSLPEVWKLPDDLIPAGMGLISSKWGNLALPLPEPCPSDASWLRKGLGRVSGKLKKFCRRVARSLKALFGSPESNGLNGGRK